MIERSILAELANWKLSDRRKPLILRGARQVGKTTVVNEFSKSYKQYISLNLELPQDAEIFVKMHSMETLVDELFFLKGMNLAENETLIFIDEIQAVPKAINLLRYFFEDFPQYHVIAAGSMLETILNEKVNIPVGRVTYRVLRPLSFEEFLMGMGETNVLEQYHKVPQNAFAKNKTLELFHTYAQIGGMPEVVNHYLHHKNLIALTDIYEEIMASYMADVEKYAKNSTMVQVIRHVIANIANEAGSRIKFQNFGNSNYKSREVGEAMQSLEKALLIHLIYPTIAQEIPLFADRKKAPRLQMLDTGLLNYTAKAQALFFRNDDISTIFKGRILEHIVGQELLSKQYSVLEQLRFWTREKKDATSEIDFILNHKGYIIPIEVKSGATGNLKSLHIFMETASHPWAIRLYAGAITIDKLKTTSGKPFYLLNLPYYLAAKIGDYMDWFMVEKTIDLD